MWKVGNFCLLLFYVLQTKAQLLDCKNIGFEDGTTNGWIITSGNVRLGVTEPIYTNEIETKSNIVITNPSMGNDPKIVNQAISQTAPGNNYSIRLGTTGQGNRFDRIKTSFFVDPERTIFLYKFAVFLQDFANHASLQKPGFNIVVEDENGVSVACSEFDVQIGATSAGALKGFSIQGDIQYKNWTTGAVDLKKYIGKKITIIVTAHSCTNERHFGYAYFDAECTKAEIKQLSKCPDQNGIMQLKAPEGFGVYNWATGQTEQIAKVVANAGNQYKVKMLPLYSLENTCEIELDYTIKYAKTDTTLNLNICENDAIIIENERFETTGNFIRNIKRGNVCDSTIMLNLIVTKKGRHSFSKIICEGENVVIGDSTYSKTGNYLTTIPRPGQCDSLVTSNILVDKKINLQTNFTHKTINIGDSLELITNLNPSENNSIIWRPTDGILCLNCESTWVKPKISALYTLQVTNPNNTCFDGDSLYIKVEPCAIHAPDIFTPNADGQNNKFYIYGGSCIKTIRSLAIYNRWGQLVFSALNFPPSDPTFGWDGTYLGQLVEPDVFAYKVIYELKEGKLAELKHAVTLIR